MSSVKRKNLRQSREIISHLPPAIPSNPLLENLDLLVDKWELELVFPANPSNKMRAQVSFDWLENRAFIIEHFASSTWIIGPDDSAGTYCVLYHDERAVSRVYQMSLGDDTWKMWRNSPGFSQRFEGQFSQAGDAITARWEKSFDGTTWEHDFDLTYSKIKQTNLAGCRYRTILSGYLTIDYQKNNPLFPKTTLIRLASQQ
jgi:hypothetical protein